ncbi:MAG: ATP-grasp domain-containing protein [Candidatus Paceibacterota bacterium]
MEQQKNIIIFVMNLLPRMVSDVRRYEEAHDKKYRILLLWDSRVKRSSEKSGYDILLECDFSKPHKLAEALLPYQDQLLAVTCRSEANIARFAKVIPHVPYLRTPTEDSLRWATDKYEMRKRFLLHNAKSTPAFTWVKNNSKPERARVIEKIGFPMVVKPSNLAASRFVTICYHEEEFEQSLRTIFRRLKQAYVNDNRMEEPKVVAEAYMEGDMYSVDSYVNSRGGITHCPLVRVTTGKDIGHDDFYNYKQTTPSALKKETVVKAQAMAEVAIKALGLRSVTAHTELMKIDDEWKIIEIGPRPGGFRDVLHQLSCDINHGMNDILVRIPRKPLVPRKCKGHATAMKWFAEREGIITEMRGIKKIEGLESFHSITVNKKVGNRAVFARNGGRSIFNVFLYNADRSKLLADIRRIEQMVDIKVSGNGSKKATKKVVKKKIVKKAVKKTSKKKS